jgi:histidinol dehydrogenase
MLSVTDVRATEGSLDSVLARPALDEEGPVEEVQRIIRLVREKGDEALYALTRELDGVELSSLRVPSEEVSAAVARIPGALREAMEEMASAVCSYYQASLPSRHEYVRDGIRIEELWRPVSRVGVYAPGGKAIYPSTVMMCALPARVAGVSQIALCAPPSRNGSLPDPVLAAAAISGIEEVYSIGGAQAIAAMAYGTQSLPRVDVIVGPGNKYVALAKRMVAGDVGVPNAFAGPSEVVVVADSSVDPEWVAMDLVVQAEHGPDGLCWLISWEEEVIKRAIEHLEALVARQPRQEVIRQTLAKGGNAVIVRDQDQAMQVANWVAPEHLELMCSDPWSLVPLVENAGAVFCGPYSPASFGDYLAGPSHVLPTFRSARFSSGLSTYDFVRLSHAIEVSSEALERYRPHLATLAECEGLFAHAESIEIRTSPDSGK